MKPIPYETFDVTTTDAIPVVVQRLSEKVSKSWTSGGLPYCGRVGTHSFEIMPVIDYRNSFVPVLCGRFESSPDGTIIHVTMRPHWLVLGFLCVWCSFVGSFLAPTLASVIAGESAWPVLLIPLGMLLFAVGMTCGGFWYEAANQRDRLSGLLIGPTSPN